MNPDRAVHAVAGLAGEWPAAATLSDRGLSTCITTARLLCAALAECGVPARPLAVRLEAWNPAAAVSVATGELRPGACKVELPATGERIRLAGGDWHGHLIVDHDRFLADFTLPAVIAAAGASGFDGVTAFCGEKDVDLTMVDGSWMAMTEEGHAFRWTPTRAASWRQTEAWRSSMDDEDLEAVRLVAGWLEGLADGQVLVESPEFL